MSRILIEITVRQTLKGLQETPKRSIRNFVDMALHFSEPLFQAARTILEHEECAYYTLIECRPTARFLSTKREGFCAFE